MARLGQNLNILNQKGTPAFYTDTFANRPAFGFRGRVFIATDTQAIYEDTGTAWTLIANVGVTTTPTLQAVCTAGNSYSGDISVNLIAIGRGGSNNNANNTLVGANAGLFQTSGVNNTTIGYGAFATLSSASDNTAVGWFAGNKNTQANNVFIGSSAGTWTTGLYNTIVGKGSDTGSSSAQNLFGSYASYLGGNIGTSINTYTSYNTFLGYNTANGYTGNGMNGNNVIIGAIVNVSSSPTLQENIIMGNNTGKKIQNYASGNWVLGGGADNGIHQLQCSGGIYSQTLSPSGVTWAVNTTISLNTANFYYVYTGAGASTITLPTALGNNNIYTFINSVNFSYTISTSGGQQIFRRNLGMLVTTIATSSYDVHQLIADGNNKFYEII
jgi:hypothetical protein